MKRTFVVTFYPYVEVTLDLPEDVEMNSEREEYWNAVAEARQEILKAPFDYLCDENVSVDEEPETLCD